MDKPPFDSYSFLVIDDNPHMRHLLKDVLFALGSRHVILAEDGGEALAILRDQRVDVVICDWEMAPIDGLQFVKTVRGAKDSPNRYVPVVVLTGHADLSRIKQARDAGVNEFLTKPVSSHGIYAHIAKIIEQPTTYIEVANYFGPDRRHHEKECQRERRGETSIRRKSTVRSVADTCHS